MARFWVRLTPRAAADEITGPAVDGTLHARVRAAPADGAANDALLRLVATRLGVPRSALSIVAGTSARRKLLQLSDDHRQSLERVWPELL